MTGYHGHKTLIDGTHVPLSQDEAAALWKQVKEAGRRRAAAMPTVEDALRSFLDAKQRMEELGWWRGNHRIKPGDKCAVAEFGSTGIWSGFLDEERKYVHYGDCASDPQKLWLKPLSDLTPEERAHMARCDENERLAHEAEMQRLFSGDEDTLP